MTTVSVGDLVQVDGMKYKGEGIVVDVYQSAKSAAFGEHKPRRGLYPQIMVVPIGDTKNGKMRHLYYDTNDLKGGNITLLTPYTALDKAMNSLSEGVLNDAAGDHVTEAEVVEARAQFVVQVPTPAPSPVDTAKTLSAKVDEIVAQASANTSGYKRSMFVELGNIGNQLFGLLEGATTADPLDAQGAIAQAITNCMTAQNVLVSAILDKAADADAKAAQAATPAVTPAPTTPAVA